MKADLLKSGLKALYYSGAHRLLAPFAQGMGLIFTLHQVCPEEPAAFSPNRILKVTPGFLESVIIQAREAGLDILSMDEACERVASGGTGRRFVCFTLDDGYRDNLRHALPVFRRHGAPFTVYVPSSFPSGRGELWWIALERAIARADKVHLHVGKSRVTLATGSIDQKWAAYSRAYWRLRAAPEDEQRAAVRKLCERSGIDMNALCRELIMTWDQVRELAADPLATIGAHTVNHYALARLGKPRARAEMEESADRLEAELGQRPRHLSYPYGDAESAGPREFKLAEELGFKTAVTTRKGVVFPEHAAHLTALPRVSLNGEYQSLIFTSLYMTGAPFALWNKFRRVDAS